MRVHFTDGTHIDCAPQHKFWTFKTTSGDVYKQASLYSGMEVSILVANTVLLYALVKYIGLHYLLAQIILTIVLTIMSFIVTRRILS